MNVSSIDELKQVKKSDLDMLIRLDPDPVLRKKSKIVTDIPENQDNIEYLAKVLDKLTEVEKDGVKTVGMSGIQIGIPLRVATCFNPNSKKTYIMVNPEILSESGKKSGNWEACASVGVGENQLFAKVYRPERVTVRYYTPTGEQMKKKANGFFAAVIQHEIDHMNGVLFTDHVKKNKIWKLKDLDEYVKEKGKYPPA